MRILQLRFKNLNSLVGEWLIDFTDPAYVCDGVFAITGPTGAGKTTLLDAICLALYGRTPRLRLSKTSNELMSRLTADCFAELEFETLKGRFRCYWGQHRSRKKLDGELQLPRHEIADLDQGTVLESSLRGVQERVEQVTGMDFERFVRSMLLAQGDFAAFLKADADARSPILEQITGTEIYSDISKQVYLRYGEERDQLRQLQAALDGLALLTPEQQVDLQQQLTALEQQQQAWQQQLQQQQRWVLLWQQQQQLLQEQQQAESQLQQLLQQQQAFLPQQQRLQRALLGLELAEIFGGLQQQRGLLLQSEQQWQQTQLAGPALLQAAHVAEQNQQQLAQQGEQLKQQYQQLLPALQQLRQVNVRLAEKQLQLKPLVVQLQQLDQQLQQVQLQQQQAEQQQQQLRQQQQDWQLLQQQAASDASLHTLLPEMQSLLKQGQTQQIASQQLRQQQRVWQHKQQQLLQQQSQLEEHRLQQQQIWQLLQQQLTEAEQQLAQTLGGVSLLERVQQFRHYQQRLELCLQLQQEFERRQQGQQHYQELLQQTDGHQQQLLVLDLQLEQQLTQLDGLLQQQQLLEQNVLLLKQIEHLTELRHSLVDGEVCPLCGAVEHPFCNEQVPRVQAGLAQLAQLRQQILLTQQNCQQLQQQQASLQQQVLWGQQQLPRLAQQLAVQREYLEQGLQQLELSAADLANGLLPLLQLTEQLQADLAAEHALLQQLEQQQLLLDELQLAAQQQQQQLLAAQQHCQQQVHQLDLLAQQGEQLSQLQQQLEQQQATLLGQLRQLCVPVTSQEWSLDVWDEAQLDGLWQQLQQRANVYGQRERQLQQLDQQLIQLGERDVWLQQQRQQGLQQLQNLQLQHDHLLQQQHDLLQQKQSLQLGDEPDQLEQLWQQRLAAWERQQVEVNQIWQQTQQAQLQHSSVLQQQQQQVQQLRGHLQQLELAWLQHLGEVGFVDEADYLAACLPEAERRQLLRQQQSLDEQVSHLVSQQQQRQQQLEAMLAELPSDFDVAQSTQQQQQWLGLQQQNQQQAGVIQHQLQQHEDLIQSQQQQLQQLERQRQQAAVWDQLYQLIGAADGKKYRNFAQGLTFEVMVYFANLQLQNMSDRYLLVRDQQQPLELNVIDNYQGGEIRSTKNLSGGESFIVSLALALGLSQMASKNIAIDSLFLDEGFGTLDDEALETALDSLSSLQQQGKLIGVISHVSALKERIHTQIQLLPQANGCSRLQGPGCQLRVEPQLLRFV